ncbi:MAG: SpoIVB peptidase [Bacillota bacterium]|nr:SpoIVB peptidase [Bacillota bacterium]
MREKKKNIFMKKEFLISLSLLFLFSGNKNAYGIDEQARMTSVAADYSGLRLIPYGKTSGIKLFADGIMVVELTAIATENGPVSKAAEAGIKEGDMITHVNGIKINSTEHFQSMMEKCGGSSVSLTISRDKKVLNISVTPSKTTGDGKYRIGAYVRDSMAGIGTITFIDPVTGMFGALGHGICDMDTGKLMPFSSGSIVESKVTSVKKGISGNPGELRGEFDNSGDMGIFFSNTDKGIYGKITDPGVYSSLKAIPVARKSEIKEGRATIICNINGNECESFEIEISKIYDIGPGGEKNMQITVTDQRLLSRTGGIVQGMSGSPVIQNGKLVGAVTHVLINDPQKGYAIFIENMLQNIKLNKVAA